MCQVSNCECEKSRIFNQSVHGMHHGVAEINDDENRANSIGQKALENTQAAWKPEAFNIEPEIVWSKDSNYLKQV